MNMVEWSGCKCGAESREEHLEIIKSDLAGGHVYSPTVNQRPIDKLPRHLANYAEHGRKKVDQLVRGTALLEPEQVDTWVKDHLNYVTKAYLAKAERTARERAAYEGFCAAAEEAIADLHAYKDRLYGRK